MTYSRKVGKHKLLKMLRSAAVLLFLAVATTLATPVQRLSHHATEFAKSEDNMTVVNMNHDTLND